MKLQIDRVDIGEGRGSVLVRAVSTHGTPYLVTIAANTDLREFALFLDGGPDATQIPVEAGIPDEDVRSDEPRDVPDESTKAQRAATTAATADAAMSIFGLKRSQDPWLPAFEDCDYDDLFSWDEQLYEAAAKIDRLLWNRHHDYDGDAPLYTNLTACEAEGGNAVVGALYRFGDKEARMKQARSDIFTDGPTEQNLETLEKAVEDILGYCFSLFVLIGREKGKIL